MDTVKIVDYSWHLGNQWEFLKLPNTEHYWISNNVRPDWSKSTRNERPENLHYVPYYEEGKYDLAVLHIDQGSIDPDPKLAKGKNTLSCDMNNAFTNIPKVIMNHGTPYWPELYGDPEGKYSVDWLKKKCKDFVSDSLMIVNSDRAKSMWDIDNSRVIIHGMDADEWFDLKKEARVTTTLSPAGWDAYYNRMLLHSVMSDMKQIYGIPMSQIGQDIICNSFDEYRTAIGKSLIYFNPTKESPMPRARTEAQLSGACIVTTAGHGAENYYNCNLREVYHAVGEINFPNAVQKIIESGYKSINGFIVPENPEPISQLLSYLYENYDKTVTIGQNGKMAAKEYFSKDRYQRQWAEVIKELTGKEIM